MLRRCLPLAATVFATAIACAPGAPESARTSHALEAGVSDAGPGGDGGPPDSGILAPDFEVAEVTVFVDAGMLEAHVIVCNFGSASSSFGGVDIVAQPDADPALWLTRTPDLSLLGWATIPAGACRDVRGRAPVTDPGWDPVFIAEVDPSNFFPELDETNNYLASRQLSIAGAADLVVTDTEWSQNGYEETNFVSKVCNYGNIANTSTFLEIFTTAPPAPASYYNGRLVPALQPGECTLVAWGISGFGNALVNAYVDINSPAIGPVPESEYGNNRSDAPFSFTQGGFDLVVRSAQLPDTLTHPARIRAQVCNVGTLPSPLDAGLGVYLSSVDTLPAPSATADSTITLPSLAGSECHDVEFMVDTSNLSYMRTHIGLLLDPSGQVSDPASNNWHSAGWKVPPHAAPTPLPDLIARPVKLLDKSPGSGSFSVDICNVGDAASSTAYFLAMSRLTDSAPPAAFKPYSIAGGGMTPVGALMPGQCSTVPFTYRPWPTVLYEEFISVWIDPGSSLTEHDALNNHSESARAVFRDGANYRLQNVQRSWNDGTTGNPGETVDFQVCNDGNQSGNSWGNLEYGFADTPEVIGTVVPTFSAQLINGQQVGLRPGECVDRSFTRPFVSAPVPRVVSSYLRLIGAPHSDLRSSTVRLEPNSGASMLQVTGFSAPPVAVPGQTFDVTTTLCGAGGTTTADFFTEGSRDTKGGPPAVPMGYWMQDVIAPGVFLTRTDPVIAPVADRLTRIGIFRSWVTRPYFIASQRITFGTGVDYTSRIISAPAQASSTFSAQVEVCNPGDVAGPPSDISLLLSWDDEFTQAVVPAALSDLVLGSAAVPGLAAGACVTATVNGDASLAPQSTRRLGSYVDYSGAVPELREDDNASPGQSFTITAPACGNASLDSNEQCDDGNLTRGDGCDELCNLEVRARQGEAIYTGSDSQRLSHAINVASHPLNPTDAFTFALWAREPARQWETLSNRWDSTGKVWSFSHDSTGVMGLAINDGSGSRGNSRAFATLPGRSRGWVHYAMTYDRGTVHLYRNGVLDDGPVRGTIPAVLSGGISDFHLGHGSYIGAMGNVLFLDRAASASEIADVFCALSDDPTLCSCGVDQHACSASDVVNLPGLVAYWPMTSGPQDTVGTYDLAEQGSNWVYNDRTPAAPVPDAGIIDSGVIPDSGVLPDSGVPLDTGVPADSGLHLDATIPDSGVPPDTGVPTDSGLHPDATIPDSGVPQDTGVMVDAGAVDAGPLDSGTPLVRARQGEAIYVAGRGQRLTVPITTANHPLDPTDAFSFALWAREPATPWETPANRWDNPGKAWSFSHNQDGFMYLGLNDGSGSRANGRRFATRPSNNRPWVHYAMTYDRGTVRLYRNGVTDDGAVQGVLPTTLPGGISDFHLGHTRYTGAMGNVTFFDRALTPADVGDLHCALSDDPSLCSCGVDQHPCSDADVLGMPGLVSYWPLTTGPQDIVGGYDFVEQGTGWIYNDRTPAPSIDAGFMDAGTPLDSGVIPDAGTQADSGPTDAGMPADSGPADAGAPSVNGPVQFATFNSALQQSLDVPVPAMSPLDSGAFTLAMWMRAPYLQWAAVAKRWDSQAGDLWLLSKKFPNTLFMSISGTASNGNANVGREFATPISGGEWIHVIVTYEQGVVRLYRGGLSDDGPIRGTIPSSLSGALPPLSIGHRMYSGSIGSVLYYDRAVSSLEAQDIFCAFSANPGSCPCNGPSCTLSDVMSMPGLVSYWPMNRDGADVVGGQSLSPVNGPLTFTPGGP